MCLVCVWVHECHICYDVYICIRVCLCMLSSLEDSKFEADLCGSEAFPADRWSFTDTGHT